MFDMVLKKYLDQYVLEQGLGKFNSFFQKFIHPRGIFVVECYIFIDCIATKSIKFIIATIIKFDCSTSFDSTLCFLTVTYTTIKSYIFVRSA